MAILLCSTLCTVSQNTVDCDSVETALPLMRLPLLILHWGRFGLFLLFLLCACVLCFLLSATEGRRFAQGWFGRMGVRVCGLISGSSQPVSSDFARWVRWFYWWLGVARSGMFFDSLAIRFWLCSVCLFWFMGSVFFLCFCFFSVGLWFLRVGYGAIGFIGSVWVGFCIVGAGHLVRFGSDCFGFVVCVCWVVGNWFN